MNWSESPKSVNSEKNHFLLIRKRQITDVSRPIENHNKHQKIKTLVKQKKTLRVQTINTFSLINFYREQDTFSLFGGNFFGQPPQTI